MPEIQRKNIPEPLIRHLIARAIEREIGTESLRTFDHWLLSNPKVPDGQWFKRFSDFTVCGNGAFVTTLLASAQSATGTEVG
ncbi:MAG: hypothetical protein LBM04_00615 [Opitutaceae bacterium]|jgi:hypothetical protein|nr:hypothetical protein [Opitutaceae bacterium]